MQKNVIRAALAASIVTASLAVAAPASAQNRWRNASTANGTFFLGVSGGPVCNGIGCGPNNGTNMIVWTQSQNDQLFYDDIPPPSTNVLIDWYGNATSFLPMCVGVSGSSKSQGAAIIIWQCNGNSDQTWTTRTAASLGAPYTGCYVFSNSNSGMVMGVSGGTVTNGKQVIQWPLFVGTPGQQTGWHPDQFWCPQ